MLLVSHRGNLNGAKPKLENSPKYIQKALDKGYDCEIDVRFISEFYAGFNRKNVGWWLGHDLAQYKVDFQWLWERKDKLWLHAKNLDALDGLIAYGLDFHCFWHENDKYTLTNHNVIWCYPGEPTTLGSIIVLKNKNDKIPELCAGICSDYPIYIKNKLRKENRLF